MATSCNGLRIVVIPPGVVINVKDFMMAMFKSGAVGACHIVMISVIDVLQKSYFTSTANSWITF